MKISYKVVGQGGYTVLLDDTAGSYLEEFTPSFKPTVQHDALFGSTSERRLPQGNIKVSLPLDFWTAYASLAACLKSIRDNAALLNVAVHLKVDQDTETQYYPNAVAEDYRPKLQGVSARHTFQFQSDTVTNIAPVT